MGKSIFLVRTPRASVPLRVDRAVALARRQSRLSYQHRQGAVLCVTRPPGLTSRYGSTDSLTTRAQGQSIQEAARALPNRLLEAPTFILMLVLSAVSIASGAVLFGWISAKHSDCSTGERLGLRWPAISMISLVSFLLGSIPVLLVSVGVVILIEKVLPGDESVLMLYKNLTNGWAAILGLLARRVPLGWEASSQHGKLGWSL